MRLKATVNLEIYAENYCVLHNKIEVLQTMGDISFYTVYAMEKKDVNQSSEKKEGKGQTGL